MTLKKYDYDTEKLTTDLTISRIEANKDSPEESLYERLGTRFAVEWPVNASAEPIIHTDKLPDNLSESEVESALTAIKTEGVL